MISPDAQSFIASDPQGVRYIYPIGGGEARPIPGINDDRERVVGWSSDGHSVYVQRYDELLIRVFRVDIVTGRKEPFKEIAPADPAGIYESVIRLTPDGKPYLYQLGRELSTLYLVDGLK